MKSKNRNKLILSILLIVLVSIIAVILISNQNNDVEAQTDSTPTTTAETPLAPPFFDGERALQNAADIMEFGPHVTNSPEIILVGDMIIERLENANWEVVTQEFEHEAEGEIFHVRNIIAKRGEGPITISRITL